MTYIPTPVVSSGMIAGATGSSSSTLDKDLYVQSDWDPGDPGNRAATIGPANDNNPGTMASPLVSLDGATRLAGILSAQGARVRIHLGGAGVGTQPWTAPTGRRDYRMRGVLLGGSEALRAGWTIDGPPMIQVTATPTYAGAGSAGTLMTLTMNPNPGWAVNGLRGYYLRHTRPALITATKRVTFEWPIQGNTANTLRVMTTLNAAHYAAGDVMEVVSPAVYLRADGAGGDLGVLISGLGSQSYYPGLDVAAGNENPISTITRVGFLTPVFHGCRGLFLDRCLFAQTGGIAGFALTAVDSTLRFRQCSSLGSAQLYGCRDVKWNGFPDALEGLERVAWADVPGPTLDPVSDPAIQTYGVDLQITNGRFIIGGPEAPSCFRVHRCVGSQFDGGAAPGEFSVEVRGRGHLYMSPGSNLRIDNAHGGGLGLCVADDASARIIDTAGGTEIVAAGGQLWVGNHAAIPLGAGAGGFSEAVGFNKDVTVPGGHLYEITPLSGGVGP